MNQYTKNPTTIETRFWTKVAITANDERCWEWQAYLNKWGYGEFRVGGGMEKSHRVAYELTHGSIPDNLQVLHTCDNPACVNPKHLFLGTNKDNVDDKVKKGRQQRLSGQTNGRAVRTWELINEIRERYVNGETNKAKLGREYGIGRGQICNILNGRNWKAKT